MIIVNRIIWVLNIILGLLLLFSYLAPFINPQVWWIAAFFGLAFPVLFLVNLIFLIYWLIVGKLKLFFPLVCVGLGFMHYSKIYKISADETERSEEHILLVSMNTKGFGIIDGKWFADSLARYLEGVDPDIVCLQEYIHTSDSAKMTAAKSLLGRTGLKHVIGKNEKGNAPGNGTVIFSRYKPLNSGYIAFGGASNVNGALWADIVLPGKDTVRVYCCHFQSNQLSKREQIKASDVQDQEVAVRKSKNIVKLLKAGFERRSEQVGLVCDHMEECPYPIILAGDFNDTQLSYAYRMLRGDGKDAFVESGKGLGNTYVGPFPSYRIDYIFHDAGMQSFNYKSGPHFYSDHKLIQTLIKH